MLTDFMQINVPFIKNYLGDSPAETAIVRWMQKKQLETIGYKNVNMFPYDFFHPIVLAFLTSFIEGIGNAIEKIPLPKKIVGSVINIWSKILNLISSGFE